MSFERRVRALERELALVETLAGQLELSKTEAWNVLVVAELRAALREIGQARGHSAAALAAGRLFRGVPGFEADRRDAERARLMESWSGELLAQAGSRGEPTAEAFGQLYEALLAARPEASKSTLRRRTGSYYTPVALTAVLVPRAFAALEELRGSECAPALRILDPALGAGAFLVQAGRESARRSGRALAAVVQDELWGVDVSPLAVAVAEACLWILAESAEMTLADAGQHLREGDSLFTPDEARAVGRVGIDFTALGPGKFDLVIGNPPWVAYAGRATQPLEPGVREHYRKAFRAFRGYPTLHGMFVELSARLAPDGVVALLIPSPVADLDGYRSVRRALSESHSVCEPLLELGQDAFEAVTQPCFALVAKPGPRPGPDLERPFVLSERRRAGGSASAVQTPPALARLGALPRLPCQLFGEMGLQTNSTVTRRLLYRGTAPPAGFSYALLEGRNIAEFSRKPPQLYLKPDVALLRELRCRLREASDYLRVKVVVRQTAAITIAALHDGTPFRNSLLACFELPEYPAELTLGLLNSTLYRALHLAARRDARQGAFPQVKIQHLRSLPALPEDADGGEIASLAARASEAGLSRELRASLDAAVYRAFGVLRSEAEEIERFLKELSPKAGLAVPLL